jgi:hypothetical protein
MEIVHPYNPRNRREGYVAHKKNPIAKPAMVTNNGIKGANLPDASFPLEELPACCPLPVILWVVLIVWDALVAEDVGVGVPWKVQVTLVPLFVVPRTIPRPISSWSKLKVKS